MKNYFMLVLTSIFIVIFPINLKADTNITPEYTSTYEINDKDFLKNKTYHFSDGNLIPSNTDILLMINGNFTSKATGTTKDNIIFVPIRSIAKDLDIELDWNNKEKKITITKPSEKIEMLINNPNIQINNKLVELDTAVIIHNNSAYVPLSFVSEILNANVTYIEPYNYNTSSISLATEPVISIDTKFSFDQKKAETTTLDMLKENLLESLNNYELPDRNNKLLVSVNNLCSSIKSDILSSKYIGNVGRYAVYKSCYLTLVDSTNDNIYFYIPIRNNGTIKKVDFADKDLFTKAYTSK